MKKIRAVVEINVPDSVELSEDDFAKLLRRHRERANVTIAPGDTRALTYKAFYRVVQYNPEGVRIAPPKPPSSFERLVLSALWIIMRMTVPDDRHGRGRRTLKSWFASLREHDPDVPESGGL